MSRLTVFLSVFATLALFPALAFAQDAAAPAATLFGVGVPVIIAAIGSLIPVLNLLVKVLPDGTKTYVSIAAAALSGVIVPALTDLNATGKVVTSAALLVALVTAWHGRFKAGKV